MCMQHAHALPMHTHMHRTLSHCGDLPHRCVLSSRWIGGRVRGWWPGPRPSRAASTHTSRTASLARMPLPRAPALMPPLPRPPVPRTRSRAPPSPSTAYPPCPHPPHPHPHPTLPARASGCHTNGSSMCASGSPRQAGRRRRRTSSSRPSRRCTRRRSGRSGARGPSSRSSASSSRASSAETSWRTDLERRWQNDSSCAGFTALALGSRADGAWAGRRMCNSKDKGVQNQRLSSPLAKFDE